MSPACPCPNKPTSATAARARFKAPTPETATCSKFPRCCASTWDVDRRAPEPTTRRSTDRQQGTRRTPTTGSSSCPRLDTRLRQTLDHLVLRPVRPTRSTPAPHRPRLAIASRRLHRRARRLLILPLRRLIGGDTGEPTTGTRPHLAVHRFRRRLRRLFDRLLRRTFGDRPTEEHRPTGHHRPLGHHRPHLAVTRLGWVWS